jgi:hypoxia up-regulated 1
LESTYLTYFPFSLLTSIISDKIALNVNADEATVLGKLILHLLNQITNKQNSGAALHGASLSRQFKTKNIKVTDIGIHDIQASYPATLTTANPRPRSITTLVFAAGSKVGTKKVMTFKRKEDFTIYLDYKTSVAP